MATRINVTVEGGYILSPINGWYLNMYKNTITGYIRKPNLSFDTFETGYILSFTDRHVMARIGCKIYALVLKKVSKCHEEKRCEYINYLKAIGSELNIVI
jgi:hypothetical protein